LILFVFALILTIVGVLTVVGFGAFGDTASDKVGGGITGTLIALMGVVLIVVSGAKEVPTNSLGVVTSFGHVETTVGSGLHEMAPWSHVSVIDGTVQTSTPTTPGTSCHGVTVRIADAQTACVPVSIQYTVRKSGGAQLFREFNNGSGSLMSSIQNQLVDRRLDVDLNAAFENYSPITSINLENEGIPVGSARNPSVTQISDQVVSTLKSDLSGLVDLRDVLVSHIQYDSTVETQLQDVLKQVVATNVAKQAEQTAEAEAQAAKDLRSALDGDPLYLQSQCLDILKLAVTSNYGLPTGFGDCVSGSSVAITASK
jgi:regulator of protease activity HflC (stomatin/prohibitin superfamily)